MIINTPFDHLNSGCKNVLQLTHVKYVCANHRTYVGCNTAKVMTSLGNNTTFSRSCSRISSRNVHLNLPEVNVNSRFGGVGAGGGVSFQRPFSGVIISSSTSHFTLMHAKESMPLIGLSKDSSSCQGEPPSSHPTCPPTLLLPVSILEQVRPWVFGPCVSLDC